MRMYCWAAVTMPPNLNPDLGPDTTICSTQPYQLGPDGQYASYLWSTGDTTPTILVTTGAVYILQVTDTAGCTGADTITIEVRPGPEFSLSDTLICAGETVTLSASPCFGCNAYDWSTGASTPNIDVADPGQYVLTVYDGTGCFLSDTAVIAVLSFEGMLGPDSAFCQGDSLSLQSSVGDTFLWSNGSTAPSITVFGSGIYWLEATQGPCSGRDTVEISFLANPSVELGPDTTVCEGDSVWLSAGPSGTQSYLWSNGATQPSLWAVAPGSYAVTVTNAAGCLAADSMVFANSIPPAADLVGLDSAYCISDQPVVLEGFPAGGVYSGPLVGTVFDPQLAGVGLHVLGYVYTDSVGCVTDFSLRVAVDRAPLPPEAGPSGVLLEGQPYEMQADPLTVGQGVWTVSPPGPYIENPSLPNTLVFGNGAPPGTYVFTWTVSNGSCPSLNDDMGLLINPLMIPSGFSPNGDEKNDKFVIRGLGSCEVQQLRVFNRWGNEVFYSPFYNGEWDGGGLADDTYFYNLDLGDKGHYSGYVVIKR